MILLMVALLLIAMFVLDQWIVRRHRQTETALAHNWFSRGERAMPGYPEIAAEDYRTALTYDKENDEYRLRLAQALLAANHFPEAHAHLESLWEEAPADGEVNLTLARLLAKKGNTEESVRYYRNAINGVWREQARRSRVDTRFELVRYLLQLHDVRQAEVELIGLQADTPHEEEKQLRLAQLLLGIGDAARAQGVYEEILKTDDANVEAWLGDGKSSFAMGDYPAAERELLHALGHDKNSDEAQQQLRLTREVLRIAPGLRGLSVAERALRVSEAFEAAMRRMNGCAAEHGYVWEAPNGAPAAGPNRGSGDPAVQPAQGFQTTGATSAPANLEMLYTSALQRKSGATEEALRKNPDAMESTMDFVFQVENAIQPLCPAVTNTDRALLILANRQKDIR